METTKTTQRPDEPNCPVPEPIPCDVTFPYRTLDGSCNNLKHPTWSKIDECVTRYLPADYGDDGSGQKATRRAHDGNELPNPRHVSNVFHVDNSTDDPRFTLIMMQWGQLLTEETTIMAVRRINREKFPCCQLGQRNILECDPIMIPEDDPFYSQFNETCINKRRSDACQNCNNEPREQTNTQTSVIDGSSLYGLDILNNHKIRTLQGGKKS